VDFAGSELEVHVSERDYACKPFRYPGSAKDDPMLTEDAVDRIRRERAREF